MVPKCLNVFLCDIVEQVGWANQAENNCRSLPFMSDTVSSSLSSETGAWHVAGATTEKLFILVIITLLAPPLANVCTTI